MKKVFAILVLATALAACTRTEQPVNETPEETDCILTVNATKGPGAQALAQNGSTLDATWDNSEKVYVFLNGDLSRHIAILTPVRHHLPDPESCQLRGSFIQLPVSGDVLTLKLNADKYHDQRGTLAYIAEWCDYAEATLTVTQVVDGKILSAEDVANFVSRQAIVKFSLKNKYDEAIRPTAFTVMDGMDEVATVTGITSDTYATNGAGQGNDGVLYVAVPALGNRIVTFTATVGNDTYTCCKSDVTLEAGKYYSIAMTMAPPFDLGRESIYTGDTFTAQDGYVLTGEFSDDGNRQVRIAVGATVTLRGVNIVNSAHEGIALEGDATIILESENTVSADSDNAGIYVPSGATLTILGDGSLTAIGGDYSAGIGSGYEESCGDITISGGTVTATGGYDAAGIGSGYYSFCGDITISGGTVTATGGWKAAGIGSGVGGPESTVTCGAITLSGGTVTATGGRYATGIGSGYYSSCGDITISDPVQVKATKGDGAVFSIGPGNDGGCGNVTINGASWGKWENEGFSVINTDLGTSPLLINWTSE